MASLLISPSSTDAAQVTLAWDASDEATGYKIYYGLASNQYTSVVDVGNDLTYTFTDLHDGDTYYFAATAYDASHLESDYSTEVSYNSTSPAEILWMNATTGQTAIWYLNNGAVSGTAAPGGADPIWTIVATADFNSDGKPDILWRNTTTGLTAIWYLNNGAVSGTASVGRVDLAWTIAGIDDFNADGKPDILWRNTTTGLTAIWYLNNGAVSGTASVGRVDLAWTIAKR
jgi:hypothetical protein